MEILPEYSDSQHCEYHFLSDTAWLGDTAQSLITADWVYLPYA